MMGDEGFETRAGNIPVLQVRGRTAPEAWEKSVLELWEHGVRVRTEYDREGDEPSRDSTMVLVVDEPMAEPRIHLAFPGGIEDLEKYRQEVLFGVHDHWIRPEEDKWTYTYHQRLAAYAPVADLSSSKVQSPFPPVDQIRYIIDKLAGSPHSRRAQGITWMPTADPATDDPPCLQRIWCRLLPVDERGAGCRAVEDRPRAGLLGREDRLGRSSTVQGAGSRRAPAPGRVDTRHPAPRTLSSSQRPAPSTLHPDSPRRLRVYCAGPMRAGGAFVGRFHEMVRIVEGLGHDALSELSTTVEWAPGLTGRTAGADGRTRASRESPAVGDDYIYRRDMHWLDRADALVAEVSAPSLGVGYEISCALHVRRIPVLCLVHAGAMNLSAMIAGNGSPGLRLERYGSENEMQRVIESFLLDAAMP